MVAELRYTCEPFRLTPGSFRGFWNQSDTQGSAESDTSKLRLSHRSLPQKAVTISFESQVEPEIPSGTIMLPASICNLLEVAGGDLIDVAHVYPVTVQVHIDDSAPSLAPDKVVISARLSTHLDVKESESLHLCPSSYSAARHDVMVSAATPQPGKRQQFEGDAIVLSSNLAQRLNLVEGMSTLMYKLDPEPRTHTSAKVRRHPGFLYLRQDDTHKDHLPAGCIVQVTCGDHECFAQIHALTGLTSPVAQLDPVLADFMGISRRQRIRIKKLPLQLFWTKKQAVDDVRSKARTGVGVSPSTLARYGYVQLEDTAVYTGESKLSAKIEGVVSDLDDHDITLTPLLLRRGSIHTGDGVYVDTAHEPLMMATVGIFNVEEVGAIHAKGSAQLLGEFKMPCWVQLTNPKKGTSLDIWMTRDPYPRSQAMVRLPRATRQLLLLERGDQVLVRHVPKLRTSLLTIVRGLFQAPGIWLLRVLIGRRKILMSIAPGHTWDDQAEVARIDPETLSILGITDGDRVQIIYRGRNLSRVVLARDTNAPRPVETPGADEASYSLVPIEFQIGIDALGRMALGDGEIDFGTVVEVERDMTHVLRKSLNLTIIPVVGTVVTVATLLAGKPIMMQISVAVILAAFFFYLALSLERAKVD